MARSKVDELPLAIRAKLAAMYKSGKTLAYQIKFIQKACGQEITPSAMSRWNNNQRTQKYLQERLMTAEVLDGLDNNDIDPEKVKKLYVQLATNFLAQRVGDSIKVDELVQLGKIVKDITAAKKEVAVEEISEEAKRLEARKLVTGA